MVAVVRDERGASGKQLDAARRAPRLAEWSARLGVRRNPMLRTIVLVVAVLALPVVATAEDVPCSAYRLAVKTGVDPAARFVNLDRSRKASLADLAKLPTPDAATVVGDGRALAEEQVYRVRGTVVEQRSGDSNDYILVLKDDHDRSLIAEIPSPTCVPATSPFYARLREAFRLLDERLHMDQQSMQVGLAIPVEITGVGFFDLKYAGGSDVPRGMAPNLFELHPILDVKFR